jgi:hypothetical protein
LLLKKLLPLFAVIILLLFALSMRTFGSLDADLLAEVTVEGNASGFVDLLPSGAPNGVYFTNGSSNADYELRIEEIAAGINPKACTVIDDVFVIVNNSGQLVRISAEKVGDNVQAIDFKDVGVPGDLDLYDRCSGTSQGPLIVQPGQTVPISFVIHAEQLGKKDNVLEAIILTVEVTYASE